MTSSSNVVTSINHTTALHILHFIPRGTDFYELLYTVAFTLQATFSGKSAA